MRDGTSPPSSERTPLDLAALSSILIAVVTMVTISNATAAVLAATGGTTALCYRTWRTGHKERRR